MAPQIGLKDQLGKKSIAIKVLLNELSNDYDTFHLSKIVEDVTKPSKTVSF